MKTFPPCQFRTESQTCQVIRQQTGQDVPVSVDACLACQETPTPQTGIFNHVTTSLALGTIRKERPDDYQDAMKAWRHLLRQETPPQDNFLGGPGTQLRALLGSIGFRPCDTCKAYARTMDQHGPDWCLENQEVILDWLQYNAKKRKVPFFRVVGRGLLLQAIKQSRKTMITNLKDAFEEVYCVTLDRRPDRWKKFQERIQEMSWPFQEIQKFSAIDGKRCKPPQWWTQGGGAWGCYQSHLRILEDCLNRGVRSVLFLEDDALPSEDFTTKAETFFRNLPMDWGMVYLGGQHLMINEHPPRRVNEEVFIPYNVNRTHAFGLRGEMLRVVYRHLHRIDWAKSHHIDHHLGRLHQRRDHPIFCPREWIIGQAEGKSNISGREFGDRFWAAAENIVSVDPQDQPFVAVLGTHSSGSSALAGVLYHLGLHLGNSLGGFYGKDPEKVCGFEAMGLASLCERVLPFPETDYQVKRGKIWADLRAWLNQRRREAANMDSVACGKYPQLAALGDQLLNICGKNLRVITSDRDLEDSIESLVRRTKKPREVIEAHQRFLFNKREDLVNRLDEDQVLRVDYTSLLEDPHQEIQRILEFLDFSPMEGRIEKAADYIQPDLQHVGRPS